MIVHDARNPRAVDLATAVAELHPALAEDGGLTAVIGGDGFLLHTVHEHGFDRCYLPLNAGTLGFLLNDVQGRLPEVVEAIAAGRLEEHRFPLLKATATRIDGSVVVDHAMNDVYLERASGQTARLRITIDGQRLIEQLTADGLIFATALGSTAYSFSAGGTPCELGLPVLCVTPICPHKPRMAPFILQYGATARVDVLSPEHRPVRVVIDGRDVSDITALQIGPTSATVRMVYLEGHRFTAQMVKKLLT
ncbi:MAG: NAD(+)/NADH kinase [Myxococcales bacterium]|nr:NAD(+)/NADH kinase [Myxococcales bacterium]